MAKPGGCGTLTSHTGETGKEGALGRAACCQYTALPFGAVRQRAQGSLSWCLQPSTQRRGLPRWAQGRSVCWQEYGEASWELRLHSSQEWRQLCLLGADGLSALI